MAGRYKHSTNFNHLNYENRLTRTLHWFLRFQKHGKIIINWRKKKKKRKHCSLQQRSLKRQNMQIRGNKITILDFILRLPTQVKLVRALHRYRRGQGSNPGKPDFFFFRLSFRNCMSCVNNCEELLYIYLKLLSKGTEKRARAIKKNRKSLHIILMA